MRKIIFCAVVKTIVDELLRKDSLFFYDVVPIAVIVTFNCVQLLTTVIMLVFVFYKKIINVAMHHHRDTKQ